MNEYISKEYIRNIVHEYWDRSCRDGELFAFGRILDEIDDAPTVYVKQGYWIEEDGFAICSACGHKTAGKDIFIDDGEKWVPCFSDNYCGNCGTRMIQED